MGSFVGGTCVVVGSVGGTRNCTKISMSITWRTIGRRRYVWRELDEVGN